MLVDYSKPVRVCDYIMNYIFDQGVKDIFTVTGRGSLFLTDGVAKHPELNSISTHHEQAAAFAAVAYAQYNDNLGACLVSTGCAGTNTLTGVLSAWQDGIPCVFISGQNTLNETSRHTGINVRTFGQQEADIVSVVESVTKYSVMLTDPSRVRFEIEKAIFLAKNGRKGPVWIDVPLDVQSMRIVPSELESYIHSGTEVVSATEKDVELVVKGLNEAARPVILIGNGVRSANAISEFETLLEKNRIPVVYTASAPDTIDADLDLSIGSVGSMGCSRAGNMALQNSDYLLIIGNRLSTITTGPDYCKFAREAKIVVIDIDPIEHSKETVEIDQFINADAKSFLSLLATKKIKETDQVWLNKCFHWKVVFPKCEDKYRLPEKVDLYFLAEQMSKHMAEKSICVSDSGFIEVILPTNINFRKNQRCIHPASQGAMGYALPAAIGAYYASKAPVYAVIGDGSIMMNLQEFETIKYNKIPLKVFVINNNAYAIIRKRQKDLFRKRTIGTDDSNGLSCPDFEKIADCFDMAYERIETSVHLEDRLKSVMEKEGPVLCEIMGVDDQEYIEVAVTRNSKNGLVRRPLEDQLPFLERELFLSEMVIKPIDQ